MSRKLNRRTAGDIDPRVRAILRAMGFQVVVWNRDTNDWCYNNSPPSAPCSPTSTAASIPGLFRTWVQQGGGVISLQHDLFQITSQQIGPSLNVLRSSSYNIQTVAECLGTPAYSEAVWDRIAQEANGGGTPNPPTSSQALSTTASTITSETSTMLTSTVTDQTPKATLTNNDIKTSSASENRLAFGFLQMLFGLLPIILLFDLVF